MKITIYSFGRSKHKFLRDGEAEYLKRLKPTADIQLVELNSQKYASSPSSVLKSEEAGLLLQKLKKGEFLIVLDERGKTFSSTEFAALLKKRLAHGASSFSLAIGGPEGWDPAVTTRADLLLSLSAMTFTAQMSRLILIEQLYRALSIIKGTPYHK